MTKKKPQGRNLKLLFVDGENRISHRLQGLFSSPDEDGHMYELMLTDNGENAISLYNMEHPDLVIISLDIKGKSGKEVLQHIRDNEGKRHTGIIFISGREQSSEDATVECLEIGADDFLDMSQSSDLELRARIKAVLRIKLMTDELRTANHRLELLSMTDDLTGLANMRCFNQKFMGALKDCREGRSGLGVVMIDLDHFKCINDSANHLVGSYVIREVGRLLKSQEFLHHDILIARYGGDEYVLYVKTDSVQYMQRVCEEIRRTIFNTTFKRDGMSIRITASIGFAWTESGFRGKAEDLIKAADLMLYQSKDRGRDQVHGLHLKYPVDLEHVSRSHLIHQSARQITLEDEAIEEDTTSELRMIANMKYQ